MKRLVLMIRLPLRHIDRPAGPANPFEAFLLIVCILQGLGVLTGTARSAAMTALLPHPMRIAWAVLLLFGGTLAVAGLYWPWDPIDAIFIKRLGLIAAGGGTFAYGVAIITSVGPPGFIVAASNLGFALACADRVYQVSVALQRFRAHVGSAKAEAARHESGDSG